MHSRRRNLHDRSPPLSETALRKNDVTALSGKAASPALAIAAPMRAAWIIGRSDLLTPTHAAQMENWPTGDPQLARGGSRAFPNIFDTAPGDTSVDFHAAAHGMGPNFFAVEATVTGHATQITGGHNPASWNPPSGPAVSAALAERIAFPFKPASATISQHHQAGGGGHQSCNAGSHGPTMGGGHDVFTDSDLIPGHVVAGNRCITPAATCGGGANVLGAAGL